jgi:hypothetical protein
MSDRLGYRSVSFDLASVAAESYLKKLSLYLNNTPGALERVSYNSIVEVVKATRIEAIRILAERYWASNSEFSRKLEVKKGSFPEATASITGPIKPILLSRYKVKRVTIKGENGRSYRGAMAAVLRSNSPKLISGGFMAVPAKQKKAILLRREGEKRYKTEALFGPSAIGLLQDDKYAIPLMEYAKNNLQKIMQEVMETELQKLGLMT